MDLNGVERAALATLGGADTVTVGDLAGTGVMQVAVDLAASGGTAGDGQADLVAVNGTAGGDHITLGRGNGAVTVNGLAAAVTVAHAEGAGDTLAVNGLGGNDTIDASALGAAAIALTLDGGDGDDILTGSAGADIVSGGRGNDTAFLGAGDDGFVWNPGDASDTVEGQGGSDTLLFNGSNVAETIDVAANGGRCGCSATWAT